MDFVAIDFETANYQRNSACSVGIVEVKKNKVANKQSYLIRPPRLYFLPQFTELHGISKDDVKNQPTFAELWPSLKKYLEGKMVVAHNAQFDIGVLQACLYTYQIEYPSFEYLCTLSIARKVWPDLCNHKLNTVANFLGLSLNHHNALDDALVAAKIVSAAAQAAGVYSVSQIVSRYGLSINCFYKPKISKIDSTFSVFKGSPS